MWMLVGKFILISLMDLRHTIHDSVSVFFILFAIMSRILRRTRVALDEGRTRVLPRRRSFGQPGFVNQEIIDQRKLRWRARYLNLIT